VISSPAANTVAYCHPLVPPEWIAACGMRPHWLRLNLAAQPGAAALRRGVCPYAAGVLEADAGSDAALILTTACDQMRHAADLAARRNPPRLFLFNVPHTWQTAASRRLYRDELERLSAFLRTCGGREPTPDALAQWMRCYDAARSDARRRCESLPAAVAAELLAAVRSDLAEAPGRPPAPADVPSGALRPFSRTSQGPRPDASPSGFRLAIVGGPLLADDPLLAAIELRGGRIVLDATEGGIRTLPASLDPSRLALDPFGTLVDAYFDAFPDPMRRPNDRFYHWLGEAMAKRRVQAIVLHRYLWCDTWHAECGRLRAWSPVPVLDLESVDTRGVLGGRKTGRLDAFLEILR
jgi:benzoyl-CoA reductase/2-hydroxyglutaryl-CoA dehydratase subunit BcrC/BadD/HgdB